MSATMINLRRITFLFPLLFLFYIKAQAAETNSAPPVSQAILYDWTTSAKAVLPAKYHNMNLRFETLTNLLSLEVRRGNIAAGGPLGCALIVQSHSPEEVATGVILVRESARNGDVPSLLSLGYLYADGRYVEKNFKEALHWFNLAAEKGSGEAAAQVGSYYFSGRGVAQDYSTAVKWYIQAANHTNYDAMKSLGFMFLNGLGVDKDLAAAKEWSLQAANEGNNRRAMLNLGAICLIESATNANAMAEAFRWYKRSAELGDALGCTQVAFFYYNGWGNVKRNLDDYYTWLERAANLGSTEAQYRMGIACRTGSGFPKDMEQALEWYRKAANKNHPSALNDLVVYYSEDKTNADSAAMARDYMVLAAQAGSRMAQFQLAAYAFRGEGVPQDCDRGKQWLEKAAANHWPKAEFILFQHYWNGSAPALGCPPYPKDSVEAIKWLRRAAEDGDLEGQTQLGVMLARGVDLEQNKVEGEKWLREAASHGYARAENDLGYDILVGDSAKNDLVESATWFKLAKLSAMDSDTSTRSKVNFSKVSAQLTPDQLSEVDRRSAQFHPIPVAPLDPLAKGWEQNPEYRADDGR